MRLLDGDPNALSASLAQLVDSGMVSTNVVTLKHRPDIKLDTLENPQVLLTMAQFYLKKSLRPRGIFGELGGQTVTESTGCNTASFMITPSNSTTTANSPSSYSTSFTNSPRTLPVTLHLWSTPTQHRDRLWGLSRS